MTSTVIFNDFRAPQLWRSRYRRSGYELWDANLHHGDVRPFACPELLCEDQVETIYSLDICECNGFNSYTQVVRGFCSSGHFLIADGILRFASSQSLCSGFPIDQLPYAGAPRPSPIDSGGGNCDENDCDVYGVTYVLTYVVQHGQMQIESAPSRATPIYTGSGVAPNLNLSWNAADPIQSQYPIVSTRLYRTETSFEDGTDSMVANNSEYVLVAEFAGSGAVNFVDTIPSDQTGGPLTTYEPMSYPAPRDGLVAVARTADGLVVAEQHRVFISIPGQPQFTYDGVVEIEDTILDIVAINNTIFVLTDNKPVKIGFRHTDGVMSIDRQVIERRLPLKSLQSVSFYDNKVYFASTHSLYSWDIGAYGSDISSSLTPLITPEQWKNIEPDTVVGTAYEFGYIFSSRTIDYSLMVEYGGDRTDTVNGTSIVPISYIDPVCFGLNQEGHILYSNGNGIYKWDWRRAVGDIPLSLNDNLRPKMLETCECCPWKISMYFDNEGKNRFSKMRIEWDERSATHLYARFYLTAFGNKEDITGQLEVISSRGFSIPKFSSAQTFCVEVEGCGIMHEIRLGTSNQELVSNSNNLIGNPGE